MWFKTPSSPPQRAAPVWSVSSTLAAALILLLSASSAMAMVILDGPALGSPARAFLDFTQDLRRRAAEPDASRAHAAAAAAAGTKLSASAFYVKNLPGTQDLPPEKIPTMHAGHIAIRPEHNSNLFFWSFEAEFSVTERKKTVSLFFSNFRNLFFSMFHLTFFFSFFSGHLAQRWTWLLFHGRCAHGGRTLPPGPLAGQD